jgi:predicted CXXCH cytochrome family protein
LVVGIAGFVPATTNFVRRAPSDALAQVRQAVGPVDLTIVASHLDRSGGLALAHAAPGLAAVLIADGHLHLIPKQAKGAVVVGSSKQGKHMAQLKLNYRGEGPFSGGMPMRRLEMKLKRATGDEAATLSQELEAMKSGNTFSYRVEALGEKKPEDKEVAQWVKAYVHFVGQFEAARGVAPPGYDGKGDFVGAEVCGTCHGGAAAQWRTTAHAHAYESLVQRGQQLDRECIGCHTAGWRHPGGFSDPRSVGMLKNVQCESCHGPGKAHAASGDKMLIERGEANARFCQRCHQEELETGFTEETHIPRIKHW